MGRDKLSVLISGCGHIGSSHAKELSKRKDVSLLFFSRAPKSARKFAGIFGGRAVGTLSEGLSSADCMLLATPPDNRIVPLSLARKMGRPVLCEKPVAKDRGDFKRISRFRENKKFFVQVAENWVYKSPARKAAELISSGKIGELAGISVSRGKRVEGLGWREKYGALLEGGIHQIALISLLSGWMRPKKVSAEFGEERPERESRLALDYGSFSATLRYSWKRSFSSNGTAIFGDRGRIFLDNYLLSATLLSKGGFGFYPSGLSDPYGLKAIHSDFLSSVRGEKGRPFYGIKRALLDVETVLRAYESMR